MINLFSAAAVMVTESIPEMDATFITAMTITGLSVVFAGLLILVVYLSLLGGVFKRIGTGKSKKNKEAAPKAVSKPVVSKSTAPAPAVSSTVSNEDEDEVAAVIAAVIAAMSAEDGKAYAVRSVKPVRRSGSGRSAWAQAGLSDLTAPFSIQ